MCFIHGTLEFPAPHIVLPLSSEPAPGAGQLIMFTPASRNTILTQWIVMVVVIVVAIVMTYRRDLLPGRAQNAFETFYETLGDFGIGLAGPTGAPYIPIFRRFFLLILFSNWIGLVPLRRTRRVSCAHPRATSTSRSVWPSLPS